VLNLLEKITNTSNYFDIGCFFITCRVDDFAFHELLLYLRKFENDRNELSHMLFGFKSAFFGK
jgi:hypothetical protein